MAKNVSNAFIHLIVPVPVFVIKTYACARENKHLIIHWAIAHAMQKNILSANMSTKLNVRVKKDTNRLKQMREGMCA